ncbi:MAG: sigma-70 family RNA polymerase sigma factor [Candidatus Hydrogenedentes bacterium]|nr:sigma-70 family RNA polymerase sigma factor [Candidatus Hydrogenedentota bacterium]
MDSSSNAEWVWAALERYERPLLRYAQRFTQDEETARDVVQDTFLKVCTAERAQVEDHLAPWLYRVCRNRALDVMKKERRMQPMDEAVAARQASPAPPPRAVAAGNETEALVRQALDGLPENQQEVFRLKFHDQMSYKQISEVTGFTVNNVRYLLHTSLKSVRTTLQGQIDLAPGA